MTSFQDSAVPAALDVELAAIRKLVFEDIRRRGGKLDADDVAQDVIVDVISRLDVLADQVRDWNKHRGYWVWCGLNRYKMRMRADQRRRARETRVILPSATEEEMPVLTPRGQTTLFEVPGASQLTPTQARYLQMLFYQELSISDIAQLAGTSERAVRAVVERARATLRNHPLDRCS